MDMAIIFLGVFVFGVLCVSIWVIVKPDSSSNLEDRTSSLEVRADNIEVNVELLHTTTNQSLAYLRKMNSTVDVITDGMSLDVPPDHILTVPQQGGARGVSREFHF